MVSVMFFRCQNEEYSSNSEDTNLVSAKTWFNVYQAKEEFHPAFKNVEYFWKNASVIQLENDSVAIAVPVRDNPENPDYRGKKMLYLYPTDNGYEAVMHEIFPKSGVSSELKNKNEDFPSLNVFSGYILTWNLKEGFVKGAEFENGLIIKNILYAAIQSDDEKIKAFNLTRKAPPIWQMELDSVSVTGGSGGGGCGGCSNVIRFTPTLGGGGTGGYIGSPGSGSGAGTGTPSSAPVVTPPSCESFNFTSKNGANW